MRSTDAPEVRKREACLDRTVYRHAQDSLKKRALNVVVGEAPDGEDRRVAGAVILHPSSFTIKLSIVAGHQLVKAAVVLVVEVVHWHQVVAAVGQQESLRAEVARGETNAKQSIAVLEVPASDDTSLLL